jgi:hypothetical protein
VRYFFIFAWPRAFSCVVYFLSEQAYTREGATLDRTVKKEYEAMEQKIDSLSRTVFNCIEDANKALALFSKSLKYHTVKGLSI